MCAAYEKASTIYNLQTRDGEGQRLQVLVIFFPSGLIRKFHLSPANTTAISKLAN